MKVYEAVFYLKCEEPLMYSSVFHINEEDGYNEEEGYFTEKNKDYTYVLTSIPKSPKIEQLYGTYSVR